MYLVKYATFANLIVPYGGILLINEKVDMKIESISAFNITSTYYYTFHSIKHGVPGLMFIGNNFYSSKICCFDLKTQYKSLLFTYIDNSKDNHLNDSSICSSSSLRSSIQYNCGKCISDGLNCSRLSVSEAYSTLHFGYSPISYYHLNFIAFNNTGETTFGNSCSSSAEQYCRNFAAISNTASSAVIKFWQYAHRLVNGYLKGNNKSAIVIVSTTLVTLEDCYYDTLSGTFSTNNTKTLFDYTFKTMTVKCVVYNRETLAESFNKKNINLFLIILILTEI